MTANAGTATLLICLVLFAVFTAEAGDPNLERAGDDRAIQQLLVENILVNKPAWHGYSADTFCIALGPLEWKDGVLTPPEGPSEPFLSRVTGKGMTVLAARACQMISLGIGGPGVVTISSQKPAFLITVSEVSHPTATTAEAQAGFICGVMCAWGVTYVLEKRDARWYIVDKKHLVVS